jgi:Uma2 family endonuclease
VTEPIARPSRSVLLPDIKGRWTVEDLEQIEDETHRYEIIDGSLIVSPAPALPHVKHVNLLHHLLMRQAPGSLFVGQNAGVDMRRQDSYLIPDLWVTERSTMDRDDKNFVPADMLLVVEVLSPSNRRTDLVAKRTEYALADIPRYWIVDGKARTVTVLALGDEGSYDTEIVVEAGKTWTTDNPFPLAFDPADIF